MKCIIPARKGSKRIKNKNFRDFHGRPVIEYSIHAAREARLFNDVVVATDTDYKGDATLWARERVDDKQTLSEFLTEYLTQSGYGDRYLCLLYACSPFVTPTYLRMGWEMIKGQDYDTVYAVAEGEGKIKLAFESDKIRRATDDDKTLYHPAGMFWYVDVPRFLQHGKFFTRNSGAIVIPPEKGFDIDTQDEWQEAEALYGLLK